MGRLVKNLSLDGAANSLLLPQGETATQPTSPLAGMIRYNTTLNMLEFYNGSAFVQLAGGTGGKAEIVRDTFTIDISTLTYTLSRTPVSEDNILVFIEGVFQKGDTYSINGNDIEFSVFLQQDDNSTLTVIHGFDTV
jgi:hypothetical protein